MWSLNVILCDWNFQDLVHNSANVIICVLAIGLLDAIESQKIASWGLFLCVEIPLMFFDIFTLLFKGFAEMSVFWSPTRFCKSIMLASFTSTRLRMPCKFSLHGLADSRFDWIKEKKTYYKGMSRQPSSIMAGTFSWVIAPEPGMMADEIERWFDPRQKSINPSTSLSVCVEGKLDDSKFYIIFYGSRIAI